MQSCVNKVDKLTKLNVYWRYQYVIDSVFHKLNRSQAKYQLRIINDELAEILTPNYAKITNNYLKEMMMLDVKLFMEYVGLNKTNQVRRMNEIENLCAQNNVQIQRFLSNFNNKVNWQRLFGTSSQLWQQLSKAVVSLNKSKAENIVNKMKSHANTVAKELSTLCSSRQESFVSPLKMSMKKDKVPIFKGQAPEEHPYQNYSMKPMIQLPPPFDSLTKANPDHPKSSSINNYISQTTVQLPPPMDTLQKQPKFSSGLQPTPYNQYSPLNKMSSLAPSMHSVTLHDFPNKSNGGSISTRLNNTEMMTLLPNRNPNMISSQLDAMNSTHNNVQNHQFIVDAPMNKRAFYNSRNPGTLQTSSTKPMNMLMKETKKRCTVCNAFRKEGFKDCPCRHTQHVSLK